RGTARARRSDAATGARAHSIATIVRWTVGHEPSVARPGRAATRRDRTVVGTAARARPRGPAADARRHAARRRAGGRDRARAGAPARRARAGDPHFADGGAACATGDRSAAGASPAEGAAEDPSVGGFAGRRPDRIGERGAGGEG